MIRATLSLLAYLLVSAAPAIAWEEGDKDAYLEKLELMKGVVQAAAEKAEIRQMCLAMSIGNDIAWRYLELNPNDKEELDRHALMRKKMTDCLVLMYVAQERQKGK